MAVSRGRPWHRLRREAVSASESLEVSKARLIGIVGGVFAHGRE